MAETEHQVVEHLNVSSGPAAGWTTDTSRAILEQMKEDEARHATQALAAGGGAVAIAGSRTDEGRCQGDDRDHLLDLGRWPLFFIADFEGVGDFGGLAEHDRG